MAEEIDVEQCNFRKFRSPMSLTLHRAKVISACRIPVGLPACPAVWLYPQAICKYTAIWSSCSIYIPWSLNSCDSFLRRKFENRAPTSCRLRPILWWSTISFQLHVKMAEETDLEKCNSRKSEASWPWPWPWIESRSHWCAYVVEVYPHTKLDRNRKNYLWTYRPTHPSQYETKQIFLHQVSCVCLKHPQQTQTKSLLMLQYHSLSQLLQSNFNTGIFALVIE